MKCENEQWRKEVCKMQRGKKRNVKKSKDLRKNVKHVNSK